MLIIKSLQGNGDFRSSECIEYLKEADIVITNPPFSLFREFISQLVSYNKQFIVIGPLTAVGYKEIFSNIKDNTIWLGMNKITDFKNYYTNKIGKVGCRWFTNIMNKKRTEPIDFYKIYKANEYPKYANFNGIDCKNISEVPIDYVGNIGLPLSILDNYCPTQFQILGVSDDTDGLKKLGVEKIGKEGIALKNKCGNKAHISENSYELYFIENGIFKRTFRRILVKKLY